MDFACVVEPLRCAGSQGSALGGFPDLKQLPPRCSKWRAVLTAGHF
ncbi:MAG: hypothetical protein AAF630_13310 [Cyanobacteria bacterium P01_C01_bin.38]